MSDILMPERAKYAYAPPLQTHKRVNSIDLLRGTVMIIMALDHVRDYFHYDAFWYSPTDLSRTSVPLFFTRWITHYVAPVFIFLAGLSAYLYGQKRSRKELAFFLLTRGVWLMLVEMFIITLFWSFNPTYPFFNLQVIWAIGLCMVILSAIIYLDRRIIALIGAIIVLSHNLLDTVHVPGNSLSSFFWSVLHEPGTFTLGKLTIFVRFPFLPWLGIMMLGYGFGYLYDPTFDPKKRRRLLLLLGIEAILLFIILRSGNFYGDASHWKVQGNIPFNILSFLNCTKYPPSLLYTLMTLGPAFIFLSLTEVPLRRLGAKVAVFGRVPMFYYLAHIPLIHLSAVLTSLLLNNEWVYLLMLKSRVNDTPELKGYGFNLAVVYFVWIAIVVILYPFCKWYDKYKKSHQEKWWLSYV